MQSLSQTQTIDHFTDLAGMESLSARARQYDPEALKETARQFESMLLNLMLKNMRQAGSVFAEGNMFDSSETRMYQDMFDQQISLSLSQSGGIGLAEIIEKQLQKNWPNDEDLSNHKPGIDMPKYESIKIDASHIKSQDKSEMLESLSPRTSLYDPALKTQGIHDITKKTKKPISQGSFDSVENFVRKLAPLAIRTAKQLGVNPKVLLAQAALETGWGKKVITDAQGNSSFNLFNIKAGSRWQGDTVNKSTLEYSQGVAKKEHATFRAYSSFEESFSDYAQFLKNSPRYQTALKSGNQFIAELQNAGYATDPLYAEKISRVGKIIADMQLTDERKQPSNNNQKSVDIPLDDGGYHGG